MEYTDSKLREIILDSDYPDNEKLIEGVIDRIKHFGEPAKKMFEQWVKTGKHPHFNVEGVSSSYLENVHKMKDIALIISYDWLMKSPYEASRLLKKPIIVYSR